MQAGIEQSSAVGVFHELIRFRDELPLNGDSLFFAFSKFCLQHAPASKSQLFQDLFVLFMTGMKKGGFFVEFGATNGVSLSNTFLLEKEHRWKGILAEPAHCWHSDLRANRKARIDHRCVWARTGETLSFTEAAAAELSTIEEFRFRDFNRDGRIDARSYTVETISLNDLLRLHDAPPVIDYMSVDTEGSEYTILESFDFSRYDIRLLTVEHNFAEPDRERIRVLLATQGYVRVLEPLSRWDDWYVKASLLERRLGPRGL